MFIKEGFLGGPWLRVKGVNLAGTEHGHLEDGSSGPGGHTAHLLRLGKNLNHRQKWSLENLQGPHNNHSVGNVFASVGKSWARGVCLQPCFLNFLTQETDCHVPSSFKATPTH